MLCYEMAIMMNQVFFMDVMNFNDVWTRKVGFLNGGAWLFKNFCVFLPYSWRMKNNSIVILEGYVVMLNSVNDSKKRYKIVWKSLLLRNETFFEVISTLLLYGNHHKNFYFLIFTQFYLYFIMRILTQKETKDSFFTFTFLICHCCCYAGRIIFYHHCCCCCYDKCK